MEKGNLHVIRIKILSLGDAERYSVRRLVVVAQEDLLSRGMRITLSIEELNNACDIGKYASTLVLPTLVINDRVICSGRFPQKGEIITWLEQAVNLQQIPSSKLLDTVLK